MKKNEKLKKNSKSGFQKPKKNGDVYNFSLSEELKPRDNPLIHGFMAKDRLRPRDRFPDMKLNPMFCSGCHKITNLRECWGCKKWFCYDCLIEHMMGCKEWLKVKGDYDILFECEKHETCDDCPLRFKCFTKKQIPKKRGKDADL